MEVCVRQHALHLSVEVAYHEAMRNVAPREPVVKQRVANSEGGGKACHDWCETKTAPWPVHKDRWSRDRAAL